jgi:Predicted transcriptional regulators
MDPIDLHLGRKLRRRRKLLGLTQQQLAIACGVRFQQIQKYECGANRMSAARLWRLAEALQAPVSYFYEGLDGQPTEPRPDEAAVLTRKETQELLQAYYALGERPRRRLLELAKAMNLQTAPELEAAAGA